MHSTSSFVSAITNDIAKIKSKRPLIHNITNFVVMNTTANALLSLGASPIMAHAIEELPDLISIANALVVNIGTLDQQWINSFSTAMHLANKNNVPVILDPVGAGASQLRSQTALDLLSQNSVAVIRANASEIIALNKMHRSAKGVDSTDDSKAALDSAIQLSKRFQCTVVVSGKTDYCVHDEMIIAIENGSSLMCSVTGMGCIATAIIGAFLGINSSSFESSINAMACTGICGEIAAKNSDGPGSFMPIFLDTLYHLDAELISSQLNLNICDYQHA